MSESMVVQAEIIGNVMSVEDMKNQMNIIEETMKAVMKSGVDYGTIPGCGDKPTLYKSGSEKLLSRFRIGSDPVIEDLSTPDEIRYRIRCKLFTMGAGVFLGAGVGEASSGEEKYKWRAAVSDSEFEYFPETHRRIKFKKSASGTYQIKQVRNNPSDIANTILKMAKKRAQVDATLTVTAASAIFTQDVEDLVANGVITPKAESTPQAKPDIKQPESTEDTPPDNQIVNGNIGRGILVSYAEVKTKTKAKPVTEFIVQSFNKMQEMKISMWGHDKGNGCNPGDKVQFNGVTSRQFEANTYWNAESIEPIIDVDTEKHESAGAR